jgi:hypothetical protein
MTAARPSTIARINGSLDEGRDGLSVAMRLLDA